MCWPGLLRDCYCYLSCGLDLLIGHLVASISQKNSQNLAWRRASLVVQLVKNLPAMRETWVWSLGWEDPLEKDMTTHSSIPAWRIPMVRGAWWATVHVATKSQIWLKWLSTQARNQQWQTRPMACLNVINRERMLGFHLQENICFLETVLLGIPSPQSCWQLQSVITLLWLGSLCP